MVKLRWTKGVTVSKINMDKKSNLQNQKNKKKPNIKNMGVDIDKNEYYEIVLSNSAHPEDTYRNKFRGY